jgi:hypothetical protein
MTGCPEGSLLLVTFVGAAGGWAEVMLNAEEITVAAPVDACNVSPVPAVSMDRLSNVALPIASVDRVSVPLRVPGPEFNLIVIEAAVIGAPVLSVAFTTTAGVMDWLTFVLLGWVTNARLVEAVMLNAAEFTDPPAPEACKVSPVPFASRERSANVAMPDEFVV